MTDDPRARIETYVENHPRASELDLLAKVDVDLPLSRARSLVAEVCAAQDDSDAIPDAYTPEEWRRIRAQGWDVGTDRQCAMPGCHEERVNDHQDSLCADHHPGSVEDEQQELATDTQAVATDGGVRSVPAPGQCPTCGAQIPEDDLVGQREAECPHCRAVHPLIRVIPA